MSRIILVGILLLMQSYSYASNKIALIIGNSQYDHLPSLINPEHDAESIHQTLQALGFKTILVKDANKQSMLEAIDNFSKEIKRDDTALFFYAGHGASVNGVNYLIPTAAKIPSSDIFLNEEFIDLDNVVSVRLAKSPANYKIMVMDACRDNPVAQTRSTGTRALTRMDNSPNAGGLSILYSASRGQVASDGSGQVNSPFTKAFIKYLNTPNITWPALMEDVTEDVAKLTNQQQQVWQEGKPLAHFIINSQESNKANEKSRKMKYWLYNIDDFFEVDRSNLEEYAKDQLKNVAETLKTNPDTKFVIEVYEDQRILSTGQAYAVKIALRRADVIRDYLVKNFQVPASRISTIGMPADHEFSTSSSANEEFVLVIR
ncbi:caspase family protein [Acinetobacter pseudolwoffii]|uniref:caspase family protein n=1 Tax=Acinetobacter pseudolwoffii TaxID=2053287 RepID=UPI0025789AF7|nr:caspase family protein [Acinetobacter pseudolwoffii]MDM1337109.1 caspase family protein [Acinetobacter pseudolwoffii]